MFETAEEGIWLIDAEAHTAEVNYRMARMLGYTVSFRQGCVAADSPDRVGRLSGQEGLSGT